MKLDGFVAASIIGFAALAAAVPPPDHPDPADNVPATGPGKHHPEGSHPMNIVHGAENHFPQKHDKGDHKNNKRFLRGSPYNHFMTWGQLNNEKRDNAAGPPPPPPTDKTQDEDFEDVNNDDFDDDNNDKGIPTDPKNHPEKRFLRGSPYNHFMTWGQLNNEKKKKREANPEPEPEPGTAHPEYLHNINTQGNSRVGTFGVNDRIHKDKPFPPLGNGGGDDNDGQGGPKVGGPKQAGKPDAVPVAGEPHKSGGEDHHLI